MGENDSLIMAGALVVGGYLIVRNFPNLFAGITGDLAGTFASQSYNTGFNSGAAFNNWLTPPAQQQAEITGISTPDIFSLPPMEQLPLWEQSYQQQTNPFYGVPILGDLGNLWHGLLTGF